MEPLELIPTASGGKSLTVTAGPPRVLGRSADCDLPVYDASISRAHAELTLAPEGLRLRDLGSTNGVQVNGVKVEEHTAQAGDTIAFGAISFRVARVVPVAPPAPLPALPALQTPPSAAAPAPPTPQVHAKLPVGIANYSTERGSLSEGAFLALLSGGSADHAARKAAALLEVSTALARAGDTDALFLQVVEQSFEVLKADRASLMTVEGEDLELAPRAVRSRSPEVETSPIPRSLLYQALTEGVALLSVDVGADERFESKSARLLHGRSAMCVPLVGDQVPPAQAQVLGLLYLERDGGRRPFLRDDLSFTVAFANIAGLALQNQRLRETALREASTLGRLRRYLSPNLDLRITDETDGWAGVERGTVVLMVAELRGFPDLVDQLSAVDLGALLSAFYSQLTEIVFRYGGSLNNIRGHSLVAVWGAPFAAANDAERALRAADTIRADLAEWNRARGKSREKRLDVAFGLESGTAFRGNVGSFERQGRQDYTIAGRPLEMASRLASAADSGEILVGEALGGRRDGLVRVRKPELRGLAAWRLVSETGS